MRHTISVLVENKFGVLTRVAGLFSGRGYNIDTLNVGPTHDPSLSRMTIVTRGDAATVEQICKQLDKLIDVVKVIDFGAGAFIDRELVLVKVAADSSNRAEVAQMAELFRAKIVDVQPKSLSIEIPGSGSKSEKFPAPAARIRTPPALPWRPWWPGLAVTRGSRASGWPGRGCEQWKRSRSELAP